MGIEPTSKAWEAFVLPLNYTRDAAILRLFRGAAGLAQPVTQLGPGYALAWVMPPSTAMVSPTT
jgi:hypothetical protein